MDTTLGQKRTNAHKCSKCDYITCHKYNFEKHLLTYKHKRIHMDTNLDTKTHNQPDCKSNDQFICELCDYITSHKGSYERHLTTDKHKRTKKVAKVAKVAKSSINDIFSCICGNEYKYRSGLYKHKKTCEVYNSQIICMNNNFVKDEIIKSFMQKDEIIKTLIEENKEIKKSLVDVVNKPSVQNTTNNTTNNTNNFNLNFFLNVECKDALNITDFISGIQLQLKDLENTGKLGYVNGISSIFINALKDLDVTKRPIHCSDVKRETLYIKDNDAWEKENENKEKIKHVIKTISNKNIKLIPLWQQENPNCLNSSSCSNDSFLKIVKGVMNASTDEESNKNIDKIITKISKQVTINKD